MKLRAAAAALSLAIPAWTQVQTHPQAFRLPNGMRVILLEDHDRPLVRARLHLPLDRDVCAARPGIGALALRVLGHSDAGTFRVDEFEQLLAGAGIELGSSLRSDGLSWSLLVRSRDQDLAMGLLADRILRTVTTPATLETDRLARWREIERLEVSPQTRLRHLLEGDRALQTPTLEQLAAVSHADLLSFYARVFRPDRAVLVLQGDLGLEQAKRLVFLSFGTWTTQAPPSAPPAPPPAPSPGAGEAVPKAQEILVHARRPTLQAMAIAVRPEDLDPESEALLGLLLPGDPALGQLQVRMEGLDLVATLESEPSSATPASVRAALLGRLQEIRTRGFSGEDLRRAREAWSQGHAVAGLHPESQVDEALAEALGHGVSAARMSALTVEALNGALRRWLDPARLRSGALAGP